MPSKNLAVSTVPLGDAVHPAAAGDSSAASPSSWCRTTSPAGDQPEAIRQLIEGVDGGERDQVLLGVTGSGKTFTMANVIATTGRPALVHGAQQDAGGPALQRDEGVLPGQRGRVFRLVLRLLPARSLRAAHRHLHREGFVDQRADRPHAPLRDARADGARRRDHRRLGVLHLRHRSAGELPDDDLPPAQGPEGRPHHAAAPLRRAAVQAQRQRLPARHLPGARRHRRPVPGPLRGQGLAHRDVRRRDRIDHRVRSADRREDGRR